jgi:hypothetical protein
MKIEKDIPKILRVPFILRHPIIQQMKLWLLENLPP